MGFEVFDLEKPEVKNFKGTYMQLLFTNYILFKFFHKAELLDAAAGVHIKFRLAGVSN